MPRLLPLLAMLPALALLTPPHAAAQSHPFEGEWIWDRSHYVPPPGMPALAHMVAETMSVARDDGVHYTSHIHQVFDNGATTTLDEDFDEDGADHPVMSVDPPLILRIAALPDGGRHVVSFRYGETHDSQCHVSDGGRTLICTGTHKAADGVTGDYICVYHRDEHVIPVAGLAPRGARAAA